MFPEISNHSRIIINHFTLHFHKYYRKFTNNFLKNLVRISIKFYGRIAQILVIVYPKFSENFLFLVEFLKFSIKILLHLSIFSQLIKEFPEFFLKIYEIFRKIFMISSNLL